jgi:hypothetical protein
MHNIFDITATVVLLILGIIWSTKTNIDTLIKFILFILSIVGIFVVLNNFGYIIKAH